MPCPTCDHTMHALGCHQTGLDFFWCPRCGTTKTCDGTVSMPALVDRCREYGTHCRKAIKNIGASIKGSKWNNLGIEECVNKPEDRPNAE